MIYRTQLFHYFPDSKRFTAELSDLRAYSDFRNQPVYGGVTNDKAGIYLQSSRTNEVVRFIVVHHHYDQDGDELARVRRAILGRKVRAIRRVHGAWSVAAPHGLSEGAPSV